MTHWFELAPPTIFVLLSLFYFGSGLLLFWVVFRSPLRRHIVGSAGITGLDTTVAVLFALLTGFLASDIGERNKQAVRAVQTEVSELRNIYTLSVASASDMQSIRALLRRYVESAATNEWPAMARHTSAPDTGSAYDALLREISDPTIARASGEAVHLALLQATVRAGTARSERLALASDRTNTLKWITVLALGLITQIAIGVMDLERPRAHVTALVVFSTAAVVALGLIALQEHPFDGVFRISPAPLLDLLKLMGSSG
jgi:hypothetical protein